MSLLSTFTPMCFSPTHCRCCYVPRSGRGLRTDESWSIPTGTFWIWALARIKSDSRPFIPSGFLSPSTSYAEAATRLVWDAWSSSLPV